MLASVPKSPESSQSFGISTFDSPAAGKRASQQRSRQSYDASVSGEELGLAAFASPSPWLAFYGAAPAAAPVRSQPVSPASPASASAQIQQNWRYQSPPPVSIQQWRPQLQPASVDNFDNWTAGGYGEPPSEAWLRDPLQRQPWRQQQEQQQQRGREEDPVQRQRQQQVQRQRELQQARQARRQQQEQEQAQHREYERQAQQQQRDWQQWQQQRWAHEQRLQLPLAASPTSRPQQPLQQSPFLPRSSPPPPARSAPPYPPGAGLSPGPSASPLLRQPAGSPLRDFSPLRASAPAYTHPAASPWPASLPAVPPWAVTFSVALIAARTLEAVVAAGAAGAAGAAVPAQPQERCVWECVVALTA